MSMGSLQFRGFCGAVLTLFVLFLFQAFLVHLARIRSQTRAISFWDLIVTTEDEKYSLSRFQFYLWFLVIVTLYGTISFAKEALTGIPEGLYLLMGVNAASAVASTAITFAKGPIVPGRRPNFFADLFLDTKNSLDLPRTQMFAWTILLVIGYVLWVVRAIHDASDPDKLVLPDLDKGLVMLMGISHSAYLGAKAVDASTSLGTAAQQGLKAQPLTPASQDEWRTAQSRFQRYIARKKTPSTDDGRGHG